MSPKTLDRWWVYVLTSEIDPRRTYVGATTDPPRRLRQHNGAEPGGGSHTRAFRPWTLATVYGPFAGRSVAQRVEWQVRKLPGRGRLAWTPPTSPTSPRSPSSRERR